MAKEIKTNACRILEKKGVEYKLHPYSIDKFTDGESVARLLNHNPDRSFKTLIALGKSGNHFVCCLPVNRELSLKAAAKVFNEKSLELIAVKDITKISGYVRGGCSPLGMKKQFKTVIHSSALSFETIYVSGGRIGLHIEVEPRDLASCIEAEFSDIVMGEKEND